MKKTAILLIAFMMLGTCVFAESGNDMIFKSAGSGKYIYCNNPEELKRDDLADDGENPSYLMSNENLTPDSYRLYVTHFNRVSKTDGSGNTYPGEDVYFDAVFTAKSDCLITLRKTAFEIPADITEYLDCETIKTEDTWSGLYACADLIGKPIYTLHTDKVFAPKNTAAREISLSKGERFFLSDYIENYAAVPYPKHVLMAADFDLKSGSADVNIFAAKTRTEGQDGAEYPNIDFENCGFGVYKRDRTYKGVADSLPEVTAELEYTLDDTLPDGSALPVTVYNQYYPKGTSVTSWTGNLNPQDDIYARQLVAENDVLPLYYKDKSKLDYYGENVSKKDKSDTWIFDTVHSDTAGYDGDVTGFSAEEYEPNYELKTDVDNIGRACSLGNYGVAVGYRLKVTNSGSADRYFDYHVTTAANIIVEVTDKDGNDLQPVISKGQTNEQTDEIMASVLLPAGETTEFCIKMTLPVQNYGGQRQSFKISSKKTEPAFAGSIMVKPQLYPQTPIDDYGIEKLLENSDEKTKLVFDGCLTDYDIVKTDTGFAAYNKSVSSSPYRYGYYWGITGRLFLLSSEFNIEKELYLGSQPIEMTYAGGKLYVKTIANGSFAIDSDGNQSAFDGYILPRETEGGFVCARGGKLQYSADGDKYYNISFQSFIPPFADIAGIGGDRRFYFAANDTMGASADGVYWVTAPVDMQNLLSLEIPKNSVKVRINDEIAAFDTLPVIRNGATLVPIRYILEKLGMQMIYKDGKIIAAGTNGLIEMEIGSNFAVVNSESVQLDVPPEIIDGRTYVPLRFLSEKLGMEVAWNGDKRFAGIDGKVGKPIADIELGGSISAKVLKSTEPIKEEIPSADNNTHEEISKNTEVENFETHGENPENNDAENAQNKTDNALKK